MKNILIIVAAAIVALAIQNFILPHAISNEGGAPKTETAYERVTRTNTLRCAYALYPPFMLKDPNSNVLSGVSYEIMTALGQASGLKIEWGPEIDWGNIAATLQSGKADAFCSTMLLTPKRGRVIAGTIPLFFTTVEAYGRPDDTRFDNNLGRINQPDVRISVNMGDLSEEVAQRLFPKAQLVYKGPMGGEADLFLNVATNKADLTLSGPSNLSTFNLNNPAAKLRKIEFAHPLMTFEAVFGVDIRELALQQMLDASLHSLINAGTVDQILRDNLGKDYGTAYFPPKPQAE